jgi:hypothetical protein
MGADMEDTAFYKIYNEKTIQPQNQQNLPGTPECLQIIS